MAGHELSDETFMEAWIGFGCFHRARLAALNAERLAAESHDGIRASLMLDVLGQYGHSFEDYTVWSYAVRHLADHDRIDDALDKAQSEWAAVLEELAKGETGAYRALWNLPEHTDDLNQQPAYNGLISGWAAAGRAVAQGIQVRTPGGTRLVSRVLNKTKHGLYVSVAYSGGSPYLVFHPEANVGKAGYSIQNVNADDALRFVQSTYLVSKLLAGTLSQVFVSWYGREPQRPWVSAMAGGESTLSDILRITTSVAIPLFKDV